MDEKPIGKLVNGKVVVCIDCVKKDARLHYTESPIYHVNIYPYKQTCHRCGKLMVQGQTESWCEFYPREHRVALLFSDLNVEVPGLGKVSREDYRDPDEEDIRVQKFIESKGFKNVRVRDGWAIWEE